MPAPKGHPLWGNPCKPKIFQSPEELRDMAEGYFQWCAENPMVKNDFIKSGQNAGDIVEIPIERPFSIEGFCNYANITVQTFRNYEKGEGYETYFPVCTHIRQVIDSQHFEGGMVGNFNANIVTRKLNLAEKQEIESTQIIWEETKTYEK